MGDLELDPCAHKVGGRVGLVAQRGLSPFPPEAGLDVGLEAARCGEGAHSQVEHPLVDAAAGELGGILVRVLEQSIEALAEVLIDREAVAPGTHARAVQIEVAVAQAGVVLPEQAVAVVGLGGRGFRHRRGRSRIVGGHGGGTQAEGEGGGQEQSFGGNVVFHQCCCYAWLRLATVGSGRRRVLNTRWPVKFRRKFFRNAEPPARILSPGHPGAAGL